MLSLSTTRHFNSLFRRHPLLSTIFQSVQIKSTVGKSGFKNQHFYGTLFMSMYTPGILTLGTRVEHQERVSEE